MYPCNQFSIDVVRDVNQSKHFHSEMEILYVLDGQVEVAVQDKSWTMNKDDVIVINSGVAHEIKTVGEHNIFCIVKYDYHVLTEVVSQSGTMFVCNSCADVENDFEEIKSIIKEMIYGEVLYTRKTRSYQYSLFYHLLDILAENYMIEHLHINPEEYQADEKLQKVIHYIHKNYQDGISLSELAEEMYISTSTLSRFFKKQTGIYFAEYVSQIRMQYAVNEMLYSNKNITKIAMDCGFSNVSSFNKVFRETFCCSPTEYRARMLEQINNQNKEKELLKEELREELKDKIEPIFHEQDENVLVFDANKTQPFRKPWSKCINIGSFYQLTRANVQYHLLYLVKQLGFTHARVWSIFSDKLMITDGKTVGAYNYDTLDTVLDFLVQNHIKPWIDFYKRPDTAVRSAGKSVWYEENELLFVSREVWEKFFTDFVKHLVLRYGKEELRGWIFEIGADPFDSREKPYYEDEDYSFFNVFEHAYRTVKRLAPMVEVGGPNGISNADIESAEEFMRTCREKECMPDFMSFGLFPYIPKENENGIPYYRCPNEDYELEQVLALRKMMNRNGFENCPLYIGEWNNSVSNRNFVNDSCFRGLYVCQKLAEMWDHVDVINPWNGTDWVSSYYDSYSIANGGIGILTKDGIRKPAFYAIDFLNRLSDLLIAQGKNYIITRTQNGNFDIVCFNANWYSANYYLHPEDENSPENLDSIFTESKEITLHIELDNVPDKCEYMLKRRAISREHGSILDEWSAFSYERNLERQDVKYLQDICIPNLQMEHLKSVDGKLRFDIRLGKQEFAVYHIFRVELTI